MERETLMNETICKMEQLPTACIQEVNDFVEFIIQRIEDIQITEGLQQLVSSSHTYDFLHDEPELYSINDLKKRFK